MTEKTINRNKQREMQTFSCPFLFIQVLLKYFNALSLFPQGAAKGTLVQKQLATFASLWDG